MTERQDDHRDHKDAQTVTDAVPSWSIPLMLVIEEHPTWIDDGRYFVPFLIFAPAELGDFLPWLGGREPRQVTHVRGSHDDVIPILGEQLSGCGDNHVRVEGMSVGRGDTLLPHRRP